MSLHIRKPIAQLMEQAGDSAKGLKRTLGPLNLIALGIGAIIGAGLFVRTAAAAGDAAGPAVMISYIIAAVGCAFAGLCYAEFASMIPIAGSAYAYAYVTMGEFIAWVIGWALILEYALAAATVSIGWSEYLNSLLSNLGMGQIPYEFSHSPFESMGGVSGIINLPAIFILVLLTLVLIKGTQESATLNAIIVVIKVSIVLVLIAVGWGFINEANYVPFTIPESAGPAHEGWNRHGWGGVLGGASIVFFAFVGFDAVSTAAQEAKNPKRDMPLGILGSLLICTILFVLFSRMLTGVANWAEFKEAGKEASVVYAIKAHMPGYEWLATLVTVAILAGFSSVILVMLMGQSRIFYSMSKDGLVPKVFSELHPKFRTPFKSNMILFVFVALFAGFVPGSVAGDLTSFGTLFAFVLVCAGIWVMRIKNPEYVRPFKTPLVPLVPILGIIVCSLLIFSLDTVTLISAFSWLILGLFVYFLYSKNNSLLRKGQ